MSTPSLFIIIIVLLHCSTTGRLESSWGSCCERCCTSTLQEPVTASKSFLIYIMKADSIWEWKQANGDTGACPRSRLGGNPGFQHPCPGPDSRLAQTFPLWPLFSPSLFSILLLHGPLICPPPCMSQHLLGSHLIHCHPWASELHLWASEERLQWLGCRRAEPWAPSRTVAGASCFGGIGKEPSAGSYEMPYPWESFLWTAVN